MIVDSRVLTPQLALTELRTITDVIGRPPTAPAAGDKNTDVTGHMNHVGVVVDDLDAVEAKVKAAGFRTHNHADYEPGRRFYFDDENGIEFEVVSYA